MAFLLIPSLVYSQVKWANSSPEFSIPAGVAAFEFELDIENTSNDAVAIDKLSASCGCTLPKLTTNTLRPGEKSTIKGVYKPGARAGTNYVTIHLAGTATATDAGAGPVEFKTNTKVKFMLEQPVFIKPAILVWKKDAQPELKTVLIENKSSGPISINSVKVNNELYTHELLTENENGLYKLAVSPLATQRFSRETMEVEVKNEEGKVYKYYVQLVVR